jgi:hypothetical protein
LSYQPVGAGRVVERAGGRVRLAAGDAVAEVTALAPDCFRVGLFGGGRPAEYPAHAVTAPDPVAAELSEGAGRVELATGEARAVVDLHPLRISFRRADGSPLAADDPERGMGFVPAPESDWVGSSLGPAPLLHKRRGEGERFFGCGERTSGLDKTSSRQIFSTHRRATTHRSTTSTRRFRSCSRCRTGAPTACSSTTRAARWSTSRRPTPTWSRGRWRAATSSTTCSAGRRRRASSSASPR